MTLPRPPRPPREHGAWALLALPLVVGAVAAGGAAAGAWLIAGAVVLAFLARDPLVAWAARRRSGRAAAAAWFRHRIVWGALYVTAALAAFGAAFALTPTDARRPLAAVAAVAGAAALVHAIAEILGAGRRAAFELVGMAAAVLAIPTMMAAAGRSLDAAAFGLTLAPFAYFASSLAWVRAYRALASDPRRAAGWCLAVHAVLATALLGAHAGGLVSRWSLAAFLPALLRTLTGLAAPPRNLKAVGLREVWVALATATLAAIDAA